MADLQGALAGAHGAVRDLIDASQRCERLWTTGPAPGKWSPSQIVEHVARALDESANAVSGVATRFPTFPRLLRPVLRAVFFNRVLRTSAFPKGRTNKAMNPESGPRTPAEARVRLESAMAAFDRACRGRVQPDAAIESTIFGPIALTDWVRFQELHVRHHCKQMPA